MIKGLILTAVGAGISFFFTFVMLHDICQTQQRLNMDNVLITAIIFGISIAVLALGVALLNKNHKKAADTNPNT